MDERTTFQLTKFDWRWLVTAYCFMVLFHLLPSLLMPGVLDLLSANKILRYSLWFGSGIAVISGYVGYRSKAITILEPGVASMLYLTTLLSTQVSSWGVINGYRFVALMTSLELIALVIGCFGAAVGEWLQARRERKHATSENI